MDTPAPDTAAFARWLRGRPGFEAAEVRSVVAVTGGASNLTYRAALGGAPFAAVALRLQREEGIFAPYDVVREAKVLACLAPSAVPVPAVVGYEASAAPLGTPFAVAEWVDAPHFGEAGPEGDFFAYVAAITAVHHVDWRALGLGFLGVPATPAEGIGAELDLVAARMGRFGLAGDPLLAHALATLRAAVPGDGRLALCQGDVNAYNYLFRDRRVVAVVDWEQTRICDPRSDVGQMLALMALRGAPPGPADTAPFANTYAQAAGAPLHGLAFFRARWLFELAVIHHLWRAYTGSEPWYALAHAEELLAAALAEVG